MPIDPITAAALIGGAASIGGSLLGNKGQKDAAAQAEAQRQANMGLIRDYGQRAIQSLTPGYQAAQGIRQQGMDRNMALAGSTFRPMIEQMQAGDFMGQEAILAGLMGQRNAIMGDPIDYGALSPRNVPVNYGALSGLTSPQSLDFQPIENDIAQSAFSAYDTQEYLRKRPDVAQDYARLKPQLLAGGDPQFRTLEGYAKWHYDNYGKQEAEAGQQTETAAPQAVFTSDQVRNAISRMG